LKYECEDEALGEKEQRFPEYDEKLVQRIREWMEEGRFKRYKRYTRSLDEAIIELCYFNILKLLDLDGKMDRVLVTLKKLMESN